MFFVSVHTWNMCVLVYRNQRIVLDIIHLIFETGSPTGLELNK